MDCGLQRTSAGLVRDSHAITYDGCERWVSSVRCECLDWLLILGPRHLAAILAEYVEHYNGHRPHRSLELQPPRGPTVLPAVTGGQVVRRTGVHGLINEYSRQAA